LGDFICPEGWHNWSKPDSEKTTVFAEYKNSGSGSDTHQRVGWSKKLTDNEALKYTKEIVFSPLGWEISSGIKWYNSIQYQLLKSQ
jgi:pectinesterase